MLGKVKNFLHSEWKDHESRFDMIALTALVITCVSIAILGLIQV